MKCGRKSGVVAHEGGRKRGVLLYSFGEGRGGREGGREGGEGSQKEYSLCKLLIVLTFLDDP